MTDRSHATDPVNESIVPGAVQKAAPQGLEENLPNSVHNTNPAANEHVSHSTGHSIVPEAIQKAVPEGLERALPDAIHDTSGAYNK
ncbi:hypothetical protein IAU60_001213 [Kwoniella sp. DSM 27419]